MYGFAYQPFRMAHFSKPRPQDAMNFPVYMDSAAPNGGLGTKDSPINNLNTAILMVTGQIGAEIHVRATASNPIRQQPIPFESTNDLTIKGWDGEDWYCYGSEIVTGWVEVGGGIWKTPLAFTVVKIAVVMTMTETVGDREFFVKLVLSDTPQTPSQGEIGYVNNELYICLPNNENPNNHVIEVARRNNAFRAYGFATLKIANVVGRNFLSSAISNGLSTNPLNTGRLIVEDSLIEYTASNGIVASAQNESTVCTNVKCFRCSNDGFNHRRITGEAVMILNNCNGSYNGDKEGQSSQGCSNHTDSTMIVNGGIYNYNVSGGMVSVGSGTIDIHGDTQYGPVLMDRNMRLGNTPGVIAAQASCAWQDTTKGTVTGDVTVSNGQGHGVSVETQGNVVGLENIKSVNNALPDQI